MRHLRLVPGPSHDPPHPLEQQLTHPLDDPRADTSRASRPRQLHLQLVGIDDPATPDDGSSGDINVAHTVTTVDDIELPQPSARLADVFGQLDLLMDGLSPDEQLQLAYTLYLDAEGRPQARSLRLRLA